MSGNTFGKNFKLTTFGESHGKAIGGIIDGCPPNIEIDFDFIQSELNRRRPGQSHITTPRKEKDEVEFLSGIYNGKTLGTPIAFLVWNKNSKSSDYKAMGNLYRPSHADFTYQEKYGIRDHRGGGRSSARETISRVIAGAIAKMILKKKNIEIFAYTSQIGNIELSENEKPNFDLIENNLVRCPNEEVAKKMQSKIEEIQKQGDTIGGAITCIAKNLPIGLGEPVFDKFHAVLAQAIMSINAAKSFEIGSGVNAANSLGSECNDYFYFDEKIRTKTNNSGGVLGGITNGEDVKFKVAFKPVPTLMKPQNGITPEGKAKQLPTKGRHDPCVIPRAVPIVEAMTAITVLDFLLFKTIF